jgi:uncharacterized Zn finger protein
MSKSRFYPDHFWYSPEPPREVKGGIKASSKKGKFVQSWWGRRWIEVLESFDIGARLARGRSYARRGQVAGLEIETGIVRAKVQGTQARPYHVAIELQTLSKTRWQRVVRALRKRPVLVARLLNAEMPQELEEVFTQAGVSLFPEKYRDLQTACSCPDWSNPCKHVAAVYYLLAEAFDRDPFLLLKQRGMSREELLPLLRGTVVSSAAMQVPDEALPVPDLSRALEPLDPEASAFWGAGDAPPPDTGALKAPAEGASLAARLGAFPFWRGKGDFLPLMSAIYSRGVAAGERVLGAGLKRQAPPP